MKKINLEVNGIISVTGARKRGSPSHCTVQLYISPISVSQPLHLHDFISIIKMTS